MGRDGGGVGRARRVESHARNHGYIFHDDWDEIDPPGSDDGPEIPHEVVMAEIFEMLKTPVGQAEG